MASGFVGAFNLTPFGVNPITLVPDKIRARVELKRTVNEFGLLGARLARDGAPRRTGNLARACVWTGAEFREGGDVVEGTIGVDLSVAPYGREVELRHLTKPFFLLRAAEEAGRALKAFLEVNTRGLHRGRFLTQVIDAREV